MASQGRRGRGRRGARATAPTTIGVVGVGRMGANIARRLHEVGYRVVAVQDANPEPARELGARSGPRR